MLREAVGHENTKHAMIYTRADWLDMYEGVFEVPKLFYEGKDRPSAPDGQMWADEAEKIK